MRNRSDGNSDGNRSGRSDGNSSGGRPSLPASNQNEGGSSRSSQFTGGDIEKKEKNHYN